MLRARSWALASIALAVACTVACGGLLRPVPADETPVSPDAAPADASLGPACARLRFPLYPGPMQNITTNPIAYNHRENWLVLGDSQIAEDDEIYFGDAGSGAPNPVAMIEYLRRLMGTDVQFKDVAHGGWTSAQVRADIPKATAWGVESAGVVNVAMLESTGANDCGRTRASCGVAQVDAILTNVFGACDDLRNAGWKVVLLSPIMSMVYAMTDGSTPGWDHYVERERAEWSQHADLWIDASADRLINKDRMVYGGGYRNDGYRLIGYLDDHHLNGNGCGAWADDIVCPAADFAESLLTDGGVLGSPYCDEATLGVRCCQPGVDPGCY